MTVYENSDSFKKNPFAHFKRKESQLLNEAYEKAIREEEDEGFKEILKRRLIRIYYEKYIWIDFETLFKTFEDNTGPTVPIMKQYGLKNNNFIDILNDIDNKISKDFVISLEDIDKAFKKKGIVISNQGTRRWSNFAEVVVRLTSISLFANEDEILQEYSQAFNIYPLSEFRSYVLLIYELFTRAKIIENVIKQTEFVRNTFYNGGNPLDALKNYESVIKEIFDVRTDTIILEGLQDFHETMSRLIPAAKDDLYNQVMGRVSNWIIYAEDLKATGEPFEENFDDNMDNPIFMNIARFDNWLIAFDFELVTAHQILRNIIKSRLEGTNNEIEREMENLGKNMRESLTKRRNFSVSLFANKEGQVRTQINILNKTREEILKEEAEKMMNYIANKSE
jgi:hypothetical protein